MSIQEFHFWEASQLIRIHWNIQDSCSKQWPLKPIILWYTVQTSACEKELCASSQGVYGNPKVINDPITRWMHVGSEPIFKLYLFERYLKGRMKCCHGVFFYETFSKVSQEISMEKPFEHTSFCCAEDNHRQFTSFVSSARRRMFHLIQST